MLQKLTSHLLSTLLLTLTVPFAYGANPVQFNVKGLEEQGVSLVPASDPSFNSLVPSELLNDAYVKALAPFSVVLRNDSGRTIRGLATVYTWTFSDGRTETHDLFNQSLNVRNTFKVDPGGTILVTPKGAITKPTKAPDRALEEVANLAARMSELAAITVSVDGLFFEDGTFVGPNEGRAFEKAMGSQKARTQLATEILARQARGDQNDVVASWLESIAKGGFPGYQSPHTVRTINWDSEFLRLSARGLLDTYRAYGLMASIGVQHSCCMTPR
jgi:hypothetical protein